MGVCIQKEILYRTCRHCVVISLCATPQYYFTLYMANPELCNKHRCKVQIKLATVKFWSAFIFRCTLQKCPYFIYITYFSLSIYINIYIKKNL